MSDAEFRARMRALVDELLGTEPGQVAAAGVRWARRELEAERAAAPPPAT